MKDVLEVIQNIQGIYESDTAFTVLTDFERVLDELDLYVYDNWEDGELVAGPKIGRHWVTCAFMWPRDAMPDPMGGKRLLDYDCKVSYKKDHILKPRKIRKPDDIRPGTKKGKLDREEIWVVEINMPKKLIVDIYSGYNEMVDINTEPGQAPGAAPEAEPAEAGVEAGTGAGAETPPEGAV